MTNNLELWDSVSRVPPEHLKGFSRSGGFKGTAIKPMWSIKTMTEIYGPCGIGWGINEPKFTIQPAQMETLVFCTVGVWHKSPDCIVYGVGGDKIVAQYSSGVKTDDEAFKKAFTDAITNALKMIGVGADIHMGLWDGNKYVDETTPPANEAQKTTPPSNVIPTLQKPFEPTKSSGLPLKDTLCKEVSNIAGMASLKKWGLDNASRIAELHPDLQDVVRNSYLDRMTELNEKAAA